MKNAFLFPFVLLLNFTLGAAAHANCATDLASLGGLFGVPSFSSSWTETSETDGKPLVMTITPQGGSLFLQFVKTNKGLWASGTSDICSDGGEVTATISEDQIQLGDAAPLILRLTLAGGANFALQLDGNNQLQISTTGWQSVFVPTSSLNK